VTYQDPYLPPYPPKKRRIWPWVILGLFVAALCAFGGIALVGAAGEKATGTGAPTHTPTPMSQPGPTGGVAPVADAGHKLSNADFRLTVKVTTKDCYGSIGCDVQYQIKAAISHTAKADECQVTYQVSGLEDAQIGTLAVHADGTYDQDSYQAGQISNSSKKLTAKVTEVDC
jgi:hypothetical protein